MGAAANRNVPGKPIVSPPDVHASSSLLEAALIRQSTSRLDYRVCASKSNQVLTQVNTVFPVGCSTELLGASNYSRRKLCMESG